MRWMLRPWSDERLREPRSCGHFDMTMYVRTCRWSRATREFEVVRCLNGVVRTCRWAPGAHHYICIAYHSVVVFQAQMRD